MEPGQSHTGIPGLLDGVLEGMAGDELEKLVEVVSKLDDGGHSVASADEFGQRKLCNGEQALYAVGQMDVFGVGTCR